MTGALDVDQALRLTSQIKTPTITDLTLDVGVGLDEPLSNVSGKIARGEELVLLARTHHDLPAKATIHGRLFGQPFTREAKIELEQGSATVLVPRLWAAEFARRLLGRAKNPDEARGKIVALAVEYGLVTPFSSILALDSESAYQQMGIVRRRRAWDRLDVQLTALEPQSKLETVLTAALAPVTLLTGCSRSEPSQAREGNIEMARTPAAAPSLAMEPESAPAPAAPPVVEEAASAKMDAPQEASDPSAEIGGLSGVMALRERAGRRHSQGLGTRYGESKKAAPEQQRAGTSYYVVQATCSDLASRPLSERSVLWQRRLRSAQTMGDALAIYDASRAACEITGQRDHRALLSLIEPLAKDLGSAQALFAHFSHDSQAISYLSRRILRRTLDPYVAAEARRQVQGTNLDWTRLDLELAALPSDEARVARLRSELLAAPYDVDAEMRLMKFLLRAGKREEALTMAARLRERAPLSPLLLRDLGDIQREAGLRDEALRTYSEIVEFDPESARARSLVGDTLLSHGWYDVAYRQFRTLVELTPGDATSELRLALSASGSGRTDEALRILRRVAERDGEKGPNDPRLAARLIAGALLSRLLTDPASDAARVENITRELRQLQLLPSAGTLYVLTWESLDLSLGLGTTQGDVLDAASVGVMGLTSNALSLDQLAGLVQLRSESKPRAEVRFMLHELSFDGKSFKVKVKPGKLG